MNAARAIGVAAFVTAGAVLAAFAVFGLAEYDAVLPARAVAAGGGR